MRTDLLLIAFLTISLAFYAFVINSGALGSESIKATIQALGPIGSLLYVGLMATAVVIAPIPSIPFIFVASFIWGPLATLGLTIIGATAGAVVAFHISRRLGRDAVKRKLGRFDKLGLLDSFAGNKGFLAILLLRLVPLFSFDIVSYAAGLTNISIKRFALASALGMAPITTLYAFLGSAAFEFNLTFIGLLGLGLLVAVVLAYVFRQPLAQATGIDLNKLLPCKEMKKEAL